MNLSKYRINLYSNVNDFPPSDTAVLSPENLQVTFSYKVISTASMSQIHGIFLEAEVRILKLHVMSSYV